jgi:hypothetical protein
MPSPNLIKFFTNFLFIVRLLIYSAIASAIIKYAAPHWTLLTHNLNVDTMNAIAINLIIFPVAFFAFVLWLKR